MKFRIILICILLMLPQSIYSQNENDSAILPYVPTNSINSSDTISFEFKDNVLRFRLGKYHTPQQLNPGYTIRELYDFSCGNEYEKAIKEPCHKVKQLYASIIGFQDSVKSPDVITITISPNGDIIYVCLTTKITECYNLQNIDSFLRKTKKIQFPPCQIYKQFMILANKKF
ncbi:hypothetical protein [Dubosiella newyorkensis]|jgi:hypothetical protein|uniref:hypothetical protein n=1 Tax=Dubosiella newyorkensis TaxID=1862672 RepID=UPI0025AC4197|nr:hypothetical protein [Dubosiella newyorkensis]